MKTRLMALTAACSILLVLGVGCSSEPDPEFGTVSAKEHDEGGTERVCRRKNGRRTCRTRTTQPEWELKLTFDGTSFEDEVSEDQFATVAEGDCWSTEADEVVDAARCSG